MHADVVEAHSDISKHHDAAADFADDFAARMVVKRGQKATPGFILMGMRCMLKGMSPRLQAVHQRVRRAGRARLGRASSRHGVWPQPVYRR